MTLNGRNVTLAEIKKLYGAHQKKFSNLGPVLSLAKCRPIILVSRNIRYMWIFAGVRWGGRVKYSDCYTCVQALNKNVFISYKYSILYTVVGVICCDLWDCESRTNVTELIDWFKHGEILETLDYWSPHLTPMKY